MMRVFILIFAISIFANTSFAQKTKQELEKERLELKKEIDENQKILEKNKAVTKENLTTLIILGNKADLQERVLNNVAQDINLLDNNIYGIQKDINKYDRLLDTLRQEYAKSMVYAYKNRGNYEFLNFIFSAENFNDAVKRIAYLKSYRTFREMQGQNILRTQELRVKRLQDLGVTKITKSKTLEVQKAEVKQLEEQKAQQDRIVENLKKQGKDINARIAEKERQVAKVNNAIKKAIAKAIKEDRDRQIAAEKEAKRLRDIAAKEAAKEAERKRKEEALIAAANARKAAGDIAKDNKPSAPTTTTTTPVKTPVVTAPVRVIPKPAEPVVITSPSSILNSNFERNRGLLPWPVDNPSILVHYGRYTLRSGATGINTGVTIAANVGTTVKSVFDGEVVMVEELDNDRYTIVVKHGKYYTSYNNLNGVIVKMNQELKTGQAIGKVASNIDGIGSMDFSLAKELAEINPETWLRR